MNKTEIQNVCKFPFYFCAHNDKKAKEKYEKMDAKYDGSPLCGTVRCCTNRRNHH